MLLDPLRIKFTFKPTTNNARILDGYIFEVNELTMSPYRVFTDFEAFHKTAYSLKSIMVKNPFIFFFKEY